MDVPEPNVGEKEVLIQVERVGICGTDVEFFNGEMTYLKTGNAHFPLRIGHEWCGRVIAVGNSVDTSWIGKLVTGDTMIGCQSCIRCTTGYQYLCAERFEVGIRNGFPGALAEKLLMPAFAIHELPDEMDLAIGAMVEPTGNAIRAVEASALKSGERLLIFGPGTIGLLCALIAQSQGIEVHLVGNEESTLIFAKEFDFAGVHRLTEIPQLEFHGIIDATFGNEIPALALELIEPGRVLVLIGIAGTPSPVDSRILILKDLKMIGILGASPGLKRAIELLSAGVIDPRPLIAATIPLALTSALLAGNRDGISGRGPKIQIDPRGQ